MKFWKKIIINFITNLFINKRYEIVYNSILIIINRYIKIIKYIFVIKKIAIIELIEIFFEKIILRFEISIDIINDKKFIFINIYWISICYYVKIKKWLNIIFHF